MARQCSKRSEQCSALCQQACNVNQQGYPEQADLLLKQAQRRQPIDLETRRQLAESLWECDRNDDAVREYSDLAREFPRDARLKERLASMSFSMKQFDEAFSHAEDALAINPRSVEALRIKARIQTIRQNFDEAVATYIRLIDIAPQRTELKMELAEIQFLRGHASLAFTLLREVIFESQREPARQAEAEWRLGLAYASMNRWVEAAEYLEKSQDRRSPSDVDRELIAVAYARAGLPPMESFDSRIVPASRQVIPEDRTPWTDLRDRLLAMSNGSKSL